MQPKLVSIDEIVQEAVHLDVQKAVSRTEKSVLTVANEQIGQISLQNLGLPGVQLSVVQWQVGKHHLLMEEQGSTADININLQLRGQLHTRYKSLAHPLDMQAGSHNMIMISEQGGLHQVKAGAFLEMFHLSLQPDYLRPYLDPNEAQGVYFLQKLEKNETFSASPLPLQITPAMHNVLAGIRNCSFKGHVQQLYLNAKITELLCLLLDGYAQASIPINHLPKQQELEKLFALKEHLHRHYLSEDLSLGSLARAFGLNEFALKKGFKALFGTSVFGFIQQLRMEHARLLLLEGGHTVAEAADVLGYANPQHFSTAYKKHFGQSPGKILTKR